MLCVRVCYNKTIEREVQIMYRFYINNDELDEGVFTVFLETIYKIDYSYVEWLKVPVNVVYDILTDGYIQYNYDIKEDVKNLKNLLMSGLLDCYKHDNLTFTVRKEGK